MAGSRRESIGTILSRLRGLLKSGAMKYEERPVWYDVVSAKPPKPVPAPKEIKKILYPEDFVRVHFYKTYSDPQPVSLAESTAPSVAQRFIDKYLELHRAGSHPPSTLFEETANQLQKEGVRLFTHEERKELRAKAASLRASESTGSQAQRGASAGVSKQKMENLIDDLFQDSPKR